MSVPIIHMDVGNHMDLALGEDGNFRIVLKKYGLILNTFFRTVFINELINLI